MKRFLPALRRFSSIRTRLTLWNVAALTLALAVVVAQIRYQVRANIIASIDHELSPLSHFAARSFALRWGWLYPQRPGLRPPGAPQAKSLSNLALAPLSSWNFLLPNAPTSGQNFVALALPGTLDPRDGNEITPPESARPAQASNFNVRMPLPPATGGIPADRSPTFTPQELRSRRSAAGNANAQVRFLPLPGMPFQRDHPWDNNAYYQATREQRDLYTTVTSGEETLRVLTHLVHGMNGAPVGVVQCAYPLTEMDRALGSLDRTLFTTIPLALLIAGLGGAFLTDRALRPVRRITRTAEQIGAEDLSRRLPVGNDDEFAHLSCTFNAMLERLEGAFNRQRRFTSDASHELKSPLTVIKANTSLALKTPRTPEEYVRRLQAIDHAADNMRALVEDLLLLARADEGLLARNLERISLNSILQEVADSTYRPDTASMSLVLPDHTVFLDGDRRELTRLFSNLISNAMRHTPATGHVAISAKDEGEVVSVFVKDTGEGIPAEHLPHLGERFYRVDASRARIHGGSGLGLAICRSIVEAHHGTLTFHSEVNLGTTVQVTLPTILNDVL